MGNVAQIPFGLQVFRGGGARLSGRRRNGLAFVLHAIMQRRYRLACQARGRAGVRLCSGRRAPPVHLWETATCWTFTRLRAGY
jgi:hypothetical protein